MYNKKELKVTPKAEGKKNPYKKDIIYDPMGQWAHPGEVTRIPSGDITMQGVPYPVMGIDNFGNVQMMMPGQDYSFPGDIVDEYPMAKKGGVPRSLKKMYTSKNIQSSINEILMKRNDTLFGHSGRRYYKPMQDGGDYNMQRALELGYNPDETEHWPSVDSETGMWLKSKNHPTAWKEFMYGQLNADLAKNLDVRVNPEGYFGDNQLQYVPKKQDGGWLDEFQNGGPLTINKDLNQAFMRGEGRPTAQEAYLMQLDKFNKEHAGKQASFNADSRPESVKKAAKERMDYIENPTVMDYIGQAGYIPLLALSNPFEIAEKLKEIRTINSDPTLTAGQKFDQLGNIGTDATKWALLNAATEGVTEGVLPGLVKGSTEVLNKGKKLVKTHPKAWGISPEEALNNPELYDAAFGQSTWQDPIGKAQDVLLAKKQQTLFDKTMALNRKASAESNPKIRIALEKESRELKKKLDELTTLQSQKKLERSGLPILPIRTERGGILGGGQGSLFVNQLNPQEVLKIGAYPGTLEDMQKLIATGKRLNMDNVAFPTKFIPSSDKNRFLRTSFGTQFMPWLNSTPLDPKNPIVKALQSSGHTDEELISLVKKLESNNIGIDYKGVQNIAYDPISKKPIIFDVNYISDTGEQYYNYLDLPVEKRLSNAGYIKKQGGQIDWLSEFE